jgi:hypothetical protein
MHLLSYKISIVVLQEYDSRMHEEHTNEPLPKLLESN